jgi:ParB family chromosome partitioning protein
MDLQVPLNRLKFGHEDGDGINARVTGRDTRIAELAANLHAQGQIENLIVKACGDGCYSVANGNRRLAAFQMIHGANNEEFLVNCTLHEVDETTAFEFSLTTAITAEQLHPVDQYEAFARLESNGMSDEEIARQYGLTEKQVRQALALGRLSPAVRQAWRAGVVNVKTAQAFTLALDHKTQDRVFAKLETAHQLGEHAVKRELGADGIDGDIAPLMEFVGAKAYRERGGVVTEDLFGTSHIISDETLLKVMARERLLAVCEDLREQGWHWAEIESDLPRGARHWPPLRLKTLVYQDDEESRLQDMRARLETIENDEALSYHESEEESDRLTAAIEALESAVRSRSFDPKKRSKLGCIVDVEGGRLVVLYGINRPAEAKASGTADDAGEDEPRGGSKKPSPAPEEPDISQALLARLSVQLTTAAATALIQDEQLALSILLGAVGCYSDCGVRISVTGQGAREQRSLLGADKMDRALTLAMALKPAERISMLAQLAANALDFQNRSLDQDDKHSGAIAICNALDPKLINPALRGVFDAKDYFAGVSKALSLKAITEALGPDLARQQEKKPKADIVAFAAENVPPTGWLPVQLRPKGYDGPPVKAVKLKAIEGGKKSAAKKSAIEAKAKPKAPGKRAAAAAKKSAKKMAKKR